MLHETKAIKTMVSSFCQPPPQNRVGPSPRMSEWVREKRKARMDWREIRLRGGLVATYQNILLILFIQEKFHAFVWSSHCGNLHASAMARGLNPPLVNVLIIIQILLLIIILHIQPLDQIMFVRQLQHRIAGDVHEGACLARYNRFVCVQIGLDETHRRHFHRHCSDHGQWACGCGAIGAQLIEHLRLLGNTSARGWIGNQTGIDAGTGRVITYSINRFRFAHCRCRLSLALVRCQLACKGSVLLSFCRQESMASMGSTGRSGWWSLLLGSTFGRRMRRTSCWWRLFGQRRFAGDKFLNWRRCRGFSSSCWWRL